MAGTCHHGSQRFSNGTKTLACWVKALCVCLTHLSTPTYLDFGSLYYVTSHPFIRGIWTHLFYKQLNGRDWRITCIQNWALAYAPHAIWNVQSCVISMQIEATGQDIQRNIKQIKLLHVISHTLWHDYICHMLWKSAFQSLVYRSMLLPITWYNFTETLIRDLLL